MFLFQLNGLQKSENIRYYCELIHTMTKVPICFLGKNGEITFEYNEMRLINPLHADRQEFFSQLLQCERPDNIPYFATTRYMEIFFIIDVKKENEYAGSLIAGPAIPAGMDAGEVSSLLLEHGIRMNHKIPLINYYRSLPAYELRSLISTSILLYYLIYGIKLDSAMIAEKNSLMEKVGRNVYDTTIANIAKNRQYSMQHHIPAYEKYLFQCVKEGNMEKLLEHLSKPAGGEPGKLSKNPLRSSRNLFICSVALISRSAIEGGLSSELALTISDSYIQQVEELNEISEINSLFLKMCCDYTERVSRLKSRNYSSGTIKCMNYIFRHLYEDISVPKLAEVSGLNRNYLSELFKKEVGCSISEYIQKEKIEEAKKLLMSGEKIMDVCTMLNFNDQSYFTKIFKKYAKQTPKQYVKQNFTC